MHQKPHVTTLSREQKFDFFTKILETSHGCCIGYAKSQDRGCWNPVKRSNWEAALRELIESAEDDTLDPEDWAEIAIDLADRLSCYLHKCQQASSIAVIRAIKVYRRTFATNEPIGSVQPLRYSSVEDFNEAASDHDAHSETAGRSRPVKTEEGRDAELEAAQQRIRFLEARLVASLYPPTSNLPHNRMPVPGPADPARRDIKDQQTCSCASCAVQQLHKQERDMHIGPKAAQQARKVVPKKESSVPAIPDNMVALLSQFALFFQQQRFVAGGEESE